jgi:hypothetical protein
VSCARCLSSSTTRLASVLSLMCTSRENSIMAIFVCKMCRSVVFFEARAQCYNHPIWQT